MNNEISQIKHRKHCMKWASLKYLKFDNSEPHLVFDRSDIFACLADKVFSISADSTRPTFEQIGYSNDNVLTPPTLYSNRPIPNVESFDSGGRVSNDAI